MNRLDKSAVLRGGNRNETLEEAARVIDKRIELLDAAYDEHIGWRNYNEAYLTDEARKELRPMAESIRALKEP